MIRLSSPFVLLWLLTMGGLLPAASADAPGDWWTWRGPSGNGIAETGQQPPTSWDQSRSVTWKAAIPGHGHSSPTVVGQRVIVTTADVESQTQSVVCFDRKTGKQLWLTEINRGGLPAVIHSKNTHATPTVVSDGQHLYATFNHHDQIQLVALDLDGKKIWDRVAGGFAPQAYQFGYAASPLLYESSVIVASEFEAAGFLAAFDKADGRELWRTPRPNLINYSSPVIAQTGGKTQLLQSGCKEISGFDPATGQSLWSTPGIWVVTCGTMVWDNERVFASGGYPTNGTIAVRSDGSGEVVWQNEVKCYEQSMLVKDGYLYAVSDAGVAYCWRCRDGEEQWKSRLGGAFSASPVLAGGNIYVSNESGTTYVFAATPDKFQLVEKNQLGDETFATLAICANQIFLRVRQRENGARQGMLYLIE